MILIEGKVATFVSSSFLKLAQKPICGISGFVFSLLCPQSCRKTFAPTVSRTWPRSYKTDWLMSFCCMFGLKFSASTALLFTQATQIPDTMHGICTQGFDSVFLFICCCCCWQEHPVVLTKFVEGAREVEMDAVGKEGRVGTPSPFSCLRLFILKHSQVRILKVICLNIVGKLFNQNNHHHHHHHATSSPPPTSLITTTTTKTSPKSQLLKSLKTEWKCHRSLLPRISNC